MRKVQVMWTDILAHAGTHALLAGYALGLALLVGAPLGTLASSAQGLRSPILALAAIGRTLPSLAVLTLLLPWLGVGTLPAIVALVLLALPPIVINVDLGLRSVAPAALDAATGLGMTPIQRFTRVSVPLALPVAVSGVRTAAVEVIASATLATFIGAGGLGDDIVRALQTNDVQLLLAGTATVAAMAFIAEWVLGQIANRLAVAA
jgi:osmoprotectant transport system permease protein